MKQRLISRLKNELNIDLGCPEDWEIVRTRAGRHQKAAGALSWFIQHRTSYDIPVGGYTALSKTLKWEKWGLYYPTLSGLIITIEENRH